MRTKILDSLHQKYLGVIAEAEAKKRESTPEAPKAWYDKYGTATPKEINKMTPQQKTRYIMEGRK